MLKINQIYKVKEGCEGKCTSYEDKNGKFIQITGIGKKNNLYYDILDEDKNRISFCSHCFKEEDLIPVEEENTENWYKVSYLVKLSENELPKDILENNPFMPPVKYKINDFRINKIEKETIKGEIEDFALWNTTLTQEEYNELLKKIKLPPYIKKDISDIPAEDELLNKMNNSYMQNIILPFSINFWHKNGIIQGDIKGKIYKNGELFNTNDKYEMISIVIPEPLSPEIESAKKLLEDNGYEVKK